MKISIVIPAYNEALRVAPLLADLQKQKYKVILVDDASTDSTVQIGQNYNVDVVSHPLNLGKGAAMKTGALLAFKNGADAVVFMDADGQHAVSDLPKFVRALGKGYSAVLGIRNMEGAPFSRKVGHNIASTIIRITFGVKTRDLLCGFRGITKSAFKKIDWESSRYGVETEMVAKMAKYGLKYCEVPVKSIYFKEIGFDRYKGISFIQAASIFFDLLKWKLIN